MKRLLSTEFAVGAFALLGLLIVIYMSLQVNDRGAVGRNARIYKALFDSATGIIKKTPVEVAGIMVGYVDSIDLEDNRAQVKIRIRDKVKVYENSSLTIRNRGVLGDKYVMLNTGTPNYPLLEDGDLIPKTFSANDFAQIAQALSETAQTIRELVASDHPQGALGQVVVHLRDMSARMNDIVGGNQERIGRILANMESFSRHLDDITGDNKDQIHAVLVALGEVATSMKDALGKGGDIARATNRMDQAMASVQRIVDKVERGEGTVGKLLNDESTVENLNQAIEGLNDTLGLFRKVQLGVRYRGEFLLSDNTLQNLFGLLVAPAPDKYLLIEFVQAPRGPTDVIDTVVTTDGTVISSTRTVQTSDNILFTIAMAKRFWDLTVRAGLFRNKGGVGMDYHLFKDKFIVSVDAFNFSRVNNRAHVRAYGTFVLYKYLLLTGGTDDILSRVGGKNVFFGAGIQFTDQDLKALITAIPGRF